MFPPWYYIFLCLLIFSCEGPSGVETDLQRATGTIKPEVVPFKTKDPYRFNAIKNDSIAPVITGQGDTVPSGIPVEFSGTHIHPDSLEPPLELSMNLPESLPAESLGSNQYPFSFPEGVEITEDMFKMVSLSKDTTLAPTLTGTGDTVSTGIPYKTEGTKKKLIQRPPVKAQGFGRLTDAKEDIKFLSTDHGLGSAVIRKIEEDSQGNMWIATNGQGLFKYDGQYIYSYTINEGLTSNIIFDLLFDQEENLWISTWEGGIMKYDGHELTIYDESHGLPANRQWCSMQDSKGNIWFGSFQGGLTKYDGEHFINYSIQEGLPTRIIYSMCEDGEGNMWFGAHANLFKIEGDSLKVFNAQLGIYGSTMGLFTDSQERVWIGTTGPGVFVYDQGKLIPMHQLPTMADCVADNFLEDSLNRVWIGDYGGGIKVFDTEKNTITHYHEEHGLNSLYTKDMHLDENQDVWIATWGGGIQIFSQNSFSHQFNATEKYALDDTYRLFEDYSGNIWYGTNQTGLAIENGNKLSYMGTDEGLKDLQIYDIAQSSDSTIYLAMANYGLATYKNGTLKQYTTKSGMTSIYGYAIEFFEGKVWVGHFGDGLTSIDESGFTNHHSVHGLSSENIYECIVDSKEQLWLATWGGGVCKIKDGKITCITEENGLSANEVFTCREDKNGNMWFGTFSGGACKFDGKDFTYFTTDEGLPSNSVWSIVEDVKGHIWLGTDNGLSRITDRGNGEYRLINFDKEDGLRSIGFYANSALLNSQNELMWGTRKGVETIDVNAFKISENIPQPQLLEVAINEQFIDFHNDDQDTLGFSFESAEKFRNVPNKLSVPHDKNHLKFSFSAIDWLAPHKIKYSYRIKELNERWSQPSMDNFADYRNIPSGSYTFEVKAIGESGIWSEPTTFSFTVRPPWWLRWWAFLIYFSLAFGAIYLIFKWRTAKLKKRQKELETQVDLATKDLQFKNKEIARQKDEVQQQKEIIEETHKEITDSIKYTKGLQDAILPTEQELNEHLEENFVLFLPKDVVSGDFYWFEKVNGVSFIAAADCTGHGVPGAVVSMVCSNALNRSVKEFGLAQPAEILNKTRELVIETFAKGGGNIKDGMDIALCAVTAEKIIFSGANNPLWIVRPTDKLTASDKGFNLLSEDELTLIEIRADKQPVGLHENMQSFSQTEFIPQKGDMLYLFTDGFADQFGGEKGKKFKYKPFKQFLMKISAEDQKTQQDKLITTFQTWKGDLEQVDDICIIGIRI